MTRNLVILLIGFTFSMVASAQAPGAHYTYDASGNRVARTPSRSTSAGQVSKNGISEVFPAIDSIQDNPSIRIDWTDSIPELARLYRKSGACKNLPPVLTKREQAILREVYHQQQDSIEAAWRAALIATRKKRHEGRFADSTYSVGAIPINEGVSPFGARTYNIPIPTAAGFKLVPSVSLGYSSQAMEGWAGYGWDIQGVSSIVLINQNEYYHGAIKAALVTASDPVFSLDGSPLVMNDNAATSGEYPLTTATGHILVKPEYNHNGYVSRFTVLYPNGNRAVFGRGDDSAYNHIAYPIMEMQDLLGNRVAFIYSQVAGNESNRLDYIRYGFDSYGVNHAEIEFEYESTQEYLVKYFAGKAIWYQSRLKAIESYDGSESICRYDLTFERKDSVTLLSRLDCSTEGESLPPLEFSNGLPLAQDDYRLYKSDSLLFNWSLTPADTHYVYRRGKTMANRYEDGLVAYPAFSTYAYQSGSMGLYSFIDPYPANQRLLFVKVLTRTSPIDDTVKAGDNFQTAELVDVDGDGIDELIRVNYGIASATGTQLKVYTYRSGTSSSPILDNSFTVNIKGSHKVSGWFSTKYYPYRREYFWGDFIGNGKTQLLAIAYDGTLIRDHNQPQTCYAALIDIDSQTVLSDEVLFDFEHNGLNRIIVNDIDSDGKSELCYVTDDGLCIYRLVSSGSFTLNETYSDIYTSMYISSRQPCHITDINGDGYIDILRSPYASSTSKLWRAFMYNGAGFESKYLSIASYEGNNKILFMDVNGDGLADFVKTGADSLTVCINRNGNGFTTSEYAQPYVAGNRGLLPGNVLYRKRSSAFIKIDGNKALIYSFSSPAHDLRCLQRIRYSFGAETSNLYSYLPGRTSAWIDTGYTPTISQGYAKKVLPIYVLSGEYRYMDNESEYPYAWTGYNFYSGVVHSRGLGFRGFAKTIKTTPLTGEEGDVRLLDYTERHDPEKMGVTTCIERSIYYHASVNDTLQVNTWDNNSTAYGKLSPRLVNSFVRDPCTEVVRSTEYTYDSLDFPLNAKITISRPGSSNQMQMQTWAYQHGNNPSRYVLGAVREESFSQYLYGNNLVSWKNKTITTLDSLYRPVARAYYSGKRLSRPSGFFNEFKDSTRLVSRTQWAYDTHGNILYEKKAPYSATVFSGNTYSYDSTGRYLSSVTDALGRTESYSGYNKYGVPVSVIDYRGHTSIFTFDSWGNRTGALLADGTIEHTSMAWGGKGMFTVSTSATGQPSTIVHCDALSREIRSCVQRFDGQWQKTDLEYGWFGRQTRKSLSFRGDAPSYWSAYYYDDYYGRLNRITEPSGRQTIISFNGTSTTIVKDGLSFTETKDACGNTVEVTDAGGTITYSLRNDGQPSSVTTPGNATTTFTYDPWGRRTSITDPSAGTQSFSYVWASDGSSQTTMTGPNGSVTSSVDRYGRTTLVERQGGFDTSYSYDSYGLISNETSTNGTSTEYIYDSLGRVASVKDCVSDGKWLKKTYSYAAASVIQSILYNSQSDTLTTEAYSYAYGHNTGVSLPDSTLVFRLDSENDLGLPTGITSGSVTRQYGYSSLGMPSFRKMSGGLLQECSYSFSAPSGNLTSRSDGISGASEQFGYDALSRLTSIQQSFAQAQNANLSISFADNGNITSRTDVGDMYHSNTSKPYQVTDYMPASDTLVLNRGQSISYTCFNRPHSISEGGLTAAFTYNGAHDRVKMSVVDSTGASPSSVLTRYYIGGRYEYDQLPTGSKERLYLGGSAYSAPMVLQRTNEGTWTLYNIGRDYQGSITHIASSDGALIAEYSYDPWGRLRDPEALRIYAAGSEPELFLGRGYSGHEHLAWFGLINMNARLYDPLLGRFLSPDPYVQAPGFTQSFNRYSYAWGNPLKYSDESGEYAIIDDIVAGLIGGSINWATNGFKLSWEGLSYFGIGFAGGVASLYISPILASGLMAGANNLTGQLFAINAAGSGNINWSGVLLSTAIGAATSYIGGTISSGLSNSFGQLTSNIPGRAWAGLINQGLTGATAGAAIGFSTSLINQLGYYQETGKISWRDIWRNTGFSALTGAAVGGISGLSQGVIDARASGENPWALSDNTNYDVSDGSYSVYQGVDKTTGEVKYVGITKRQPCIRWAEHQASGTNRANLDYRVLYSGLNKTSARIQEQSIINQYGLGNLYNKINSISPLFWDYYGIKP